MKTQKYKLWNNGIGWLVFAVSFVVYLSTIEPNFSFWDCGEYISSAVKLQVTHAPGAAFFQLIGAVVAIFAFGKGEHYSIVINALSALYSALTILFLFWSVTHIVRGLLLHLKKEIKDVDYWIIFLSGSIGALCFAFSDTFWFSAVEGEVYSMASLFIALLIWFILKWEDEADKPYSERWIILIFFTLGLSIGVHMMCMLAIPGICLLYYAKKYDFTWKSFIIANFITLLILILVFKIVFPLIMSLFGKTEIFAVNGLGLPFHSGTLIAFIILVAVCYFAIKKSIQSKKSIYQTISLSLIFMVIGFSCWMMIPIRANANPPMNLNNPNNAIGMLDYYNREQYGDWPTLYGENYTAQLDPNGIEKNEDGSFKSGKEAGLFKLADVYEPDYTIGEYRKVGERTNYVFSKNQVSFMPRMFSRDRSVMANYISMFGAPDFTFNYANQELSDNPEAHKLFDELREKYNNGTITVDDYLQAKNYELINVQKPSFAQNLDYFISFQNGYYFIRYLLWNFVGRQNDLEGNMENTKGNWISGIPFIDNARLGDQKDMPAMYSNESTVKFFFLPFILGLIGFFFQAGKDFKRFYALLAVFVLTSVGIIFYTGVKPFEPRERDYAMVGSFHIFALWIGLGAAALLYFLFKQSKSKPIVGIVGIVLLGIPLMMGFQNYNPHDRSGRYTAYDYSYSTLQSLKPQGILFVYGDNDTYPVWAVQETEGFRNDVKVVNFTLASTPWYVDQIKRRTYKAMPVPSVLKHEEYRDGSNDQIFVFNKNSWVEFFKNVDTQGLPTDPFPSFRKYLTKDSMTLKEAIDFLKIKSKEKDQILKMFFGEDKYDNFNFLPTGNFILPVNKANAVKAGIMRPEDVSKSVDYITINYRGRTMFKNNLILLDILANFDWKRPISFSSGGVYDDENIFYLNDYLQYDGFSYSLVPIYTKEKSSGQMGRVVGDDLYKRVKNFKWGNFKDLSVHFDETCTQNIVSYRSAASRAAEALTLQGDKSKATELLDLVNTEIPIAKYNDARSLSAIVYGYIISGQEQKGLKLAQQLQKDLLKKYDYYNKLSSKEQAFAGRELRAAPFEYSLVVGVVSEAYIKMGQKEKGHDYVLKSIEPIDKRYQDFIKYLELMGKEKANKESVKIQKITPFYQYLFDVMKPYDSTYQAEKMNQITEGLIKVTQ